MCGHGLLMAEVCHKLPSTVVFPRTDSASLVTQVVAGDDALKQLASDAFRSYVRAYATHSIDVKKSGCHVKNLHLGHIAFAHGLKDTPTMLGASGSSNERKRKRAEEALAKQRKAKKSLYRTAHIMAAGEGQAVGHKSKAQAAAG